ncbi:MAG TPA: sulfatase [Thermoanaerobaculia bacterium]|nr:sulfatase [Thermoanaerobaculia bacterium]
MLVLLPLALLLRRYHPAQRAGDRLRASWAVCFGLAATVAAWAIADLLAAQWLPPAPSDWLALAVALPIGLTASYLQPPRRWLLTWCWLSVALTVASLLPWPGPGGSSSSDQPAKASRSEPSRARGAGGPDRRPDVVLVSIDTLRADHLGAYGRAPSITPEMDRIAAEGVVFARTVSASPWTTPSVASLLTGLPVVRHDAGRPLAAGPTFERSPLGGSFTTLAERFAAAGYRTRAVIANGFLSPGSGMAQGFDEYVNPSFGYGFAGILRDLPLTRLILAFVPAERWGDPRAAGVTDRALAWLAEKDPAPLFLWAHYIDPHVPYQRDPARLDPADEMDMMRQTPPPLLPDGTVVGEVFGSSELVRSGMLWLGPKDRERLASYYAGEVAYTDRHVGRLFAALRRRPVGRPLVVALTADHGEEFWDHGHFEHGHDYYCEVTRVPLVFWGRGVVPTGRRVETLAGIVDVGATLLDWSGLPQPESKFAGTGRSLVASLAAPTSADPPPVAYTAGGNLYGLPSALLE